MGIRILLLILSFCIGTLTSQAQDRPARPTSIVTGTFIGISKPLRDLPQMTQQEFDRLGEKAKTKQLNERLKLRSYPFASTALPKGADPVWQQTMGTAGGSREPAANFNGQDSPYYPPDCNGAVGPSHYMQAINCVYSIYNKSGTLVAGPTNMNLLFGSVPGTTYNDGDPVILYDEQAGRWLATEFSISGSTDYMLMAVSTTSDPTGPWYQYSFVVAIMPDYPKFGVWRDGYYMGDNNSSGNDIYVFQRSQMLVGGTAQMIGFDNPYRPTSVDGFMMVPPVDNDGSFAPTNAPGTFIAFNDDAIGGGADELWIYELSVNWSTPSSSTFSRVQQIPVAAFSSNFGTTWNNISQPTSQKLDAIPQVIMNVPQYRNFGTYQTIVCCHTVNVDNNTATNHAGIRWYELRRGTQVSGSWAIRQQGTYAPDAHSRWMGSIMLNGSGKIGLGYSASSSTVYPGIRYCGQSSVSYANASGVLDIPEGIIQDGANAQSSYNRWGDYSDLSVDPVDGQTFWYTTEYIGSGGVRKTKIASFKIGNIPVATTMAATAVTATTATLNGKINPAGLSTNYNFDWGTTTSYGNSTAILSAGSGITEVSVNASLTGLNLGTAYHFRIVASNSDGTTNGDDLFFTPGSATVITSPLSSITLTTASSGGNITSDGGFAVTARGVCWSTSANPSITGNHTTDGSGLGVFSSVLSGLTLNTTYHVRAYAVNGSGTNYGNELIFTTLCGIYNPPFVESFSGTTIPTCWSQFDNQGSGQVWLFGSITGVSPSPSLTGNYAYLNSDAYGSGFSQNADLISPTINLTAYSAITLQFNHYFKAYSGSAGTLSYSIDNGFNWTQIATFVTTSVSNPVLFSQNIPAAAGHAQVKFKWNFTGSYSYYWAFDDVSVTGTSSSAPVVATTVASAITQTSAMAGGNVTSPGSSGVTARGVCWGTSLSPTIAGNHTTDGSGTGVFSSSITGLICGTTYHVRAYATNSSGTSYGDALPFTTLCGSIAAFPWTESFENGGLIPNCWSQEQVNSSGIFWNFISGSGNNNPPSAHAGFYNACLNDASSIDNKTKLITPPVNLSSLVNPQLKFWHTQAAWGGDQDKLIVYYRTSSTGTWISLATYTSSITSWTQETISLPAASTAYYIAFEGNAKFGYGICLDDVSITGTSPSLTVTPSNQYVTVVAGTTAFTVTSNSSWTATSNQLWCTVTPSGAGNGIITANYTQNASGSSRVAEITVTAAGLAPIVVTVTESGSQGRILNLTVFLEGLYDGNGMMHPAVDQNGAHWGVTIADKIIVELHDAVNYSNIIYYDANVFLNTNGSASVTIPEIYTGNYYITIKNRNSIETMSAFFVSFSTPSIVFSFDSPSKAYGSNLQEMIDGRWVIFGGDLNQDGIVDAGDISLLDNLVPLALSGYLPEDANGDGLVDSSDLSLVGNNAVSAVMAKTP